MPYVNPDCFHLSASSIAAFKACPTRWRLAYREGIRSAQDTDSQRQGTNWHAMHECYANALSEGLTQEAALDKVLELLNEKYATKPDYKTMEEWSLERQILLTSFMGYLWYYQNDPIEFLYSELAFDLPIHLIKTGLPLSITEALRVGKIDHVIRWQGSVGALERKSTSRSIAPDSDYWDKSKKDTQVSMYALAFLDMAVSKTLPEKIVFNTGERFGNTLYDVWHKPTIKPKMLTQAETKEFIETGVYFDQKFEVMSGTIGNDARITVDGEPAEVEPGKKGFAIRESVSMYGARLMADIYERPEFYYVRREIARTDAEIRGFRKQLFNIYQSQKLMAKSGCFYENEQQCRATFACQYIPICYGPGADAVCDGHTTPPGFKRIFVDLTVNGQEVEE